MFGRSLSALQRLRPAPRAASTDDADSGQPNVGSCGEARLSAACEEALPAYLLLVLGGMEACAARAVHEALAATHRCRVPAAAPADPPSAVPRRLSGLQLCNPSHAEVPRLGRGGCPHARPASI